MDMSFPHVQHDLSICEKKIPIISPVNSIAPSGYVNGKKKKKKKKKPILHVREFVHCLLDIDATKVPTQLWMGLLGWVIA